MGDVTHREKNDFISQEWPDLNNGHKGSAKGVTIIDEFHSNFK